MVLPEKAMAPHSSTLAWKIPWMEEPGGLQSMGWLRVRHDWATSLSRIEEGNGNPLQCSCLENPRDRWATVSGVAQSRTRLNRLSSSSSMVLQVMKSPWGLQPQRPTLILFITCNLKYIFYSPSFMLAIIAPPPSHTLVGTFIWSPFYPPYQFESCSLPPYSISKKWYLMVIK